MTNFPRYITDILAKINALVQTRSAADLLVQAWNLVTGYLLTGEISVAVLDEISLRSNPKIVYFYHQKICSSDQSIQKQFNLILKKNFTSGN